MLGYWSGQFTKESYFGRVSDDFGMDEVRCVGNEASIFECDFEIGHDCFGGEGLGVICSGIFFDATEATPTPEEDLIFDAFPSNFDPLPSNTPDYHELLGPDYVYD